MSGDWQFARRPFWLFSHLFAATVVVSFVFLGLWQLDRLDQRRADNAVVEVRSAQVEPLTEAVGELDDPAVTGDDLDYQAVSGSVRVVEADFARIVNRTGSGVAGEHVVAILELSDGSLLAANRGFVPLGFDDDLETPPEGPQPVEGWLRKSVEREGIGAVDQGVGSLLPRFDTERIAARYGRDLPDVWLQLAPGSFGQAGLPEALDLPPLDDGPHFGYAMQWFIFATLGVLFYGALLRRQAKGHEATVTVSAAGHENK